MLRPPMTRIATAWSAFARPFTLLAGLRRRPADWRRFLLTTTVQAAVTLAIAAAFLALGDGKARKPADETSLVPESVRHAWAWAVVVWSALVTAQWITLAFGREFHRPIGRALSDVAGIAPEDSDAPPRVRVDWKWLKKKGRQRLRGVLVLLPGFVAFVPILLVTLPFDLNNVVMPPLMAGWSFYWWCVFTAGRSDRAWRHEPTTLPTPVRWWLARTERTPGFRWFLPRWVGRFGVWATRREAAPAVAMERAPLVFVGLGLARLVLSWPILRLFFRAAVDTAAAEALERLGPLPAEAPASTSAPAPDAR